MSEQRYLQVHTDDPGNISITPAATSGHCFLSREKEKDFESTFADRRVATRRSLRKVASGTISTDNVWATLRNNQTSPGKKSDYLVTPTYI